MKNKTLFIQSLGVLIAGIVSVQSFGDSPKLPSFSDPNPKATDSIADGEKSRHKELYQHITQQARENAFDPMGELKNLWGEETLKKFEANLNQQQQNDPKSYNAWLAYKEGLRQGFTGQYYHASDTVGFNPDNVACRQYQKVPEGANPEHYNHMYTFCRLAFDSASDYLFQHLSEISFAPNRGVSQCKKAFETGQNKARYTCYESCYEKHWMAIRYGAFSEDPDKKEREISPGCYARGLLSIYATCQDPNQLPAQTEFVDSSRLNKSIYQGLGRGQTQHKKDGSSEAAK